MGAIHVDVTLTNPADRSRSWTGPMLVDTGATDSVVPRPILGTIGVVPESTRTYELADGAEVEMDIATARIEFMGELTAGLVVFGGADVEPLLGVTALESVGVEVDPRNQRLTKLSAVRLKAAPTPPRTGGKTPKPPGLVKPDYRPPPPPPSPTSVKPCFADQA